MFTLLKKKWIRIVKICDFLNIRKRRKIIRATVLVKIIKLVKKEAQSRSPLKKIFQQLNIP